MFALSNTSNALITSLPQKQQSCQITYKPFRFWIACTMSSCLKLSFCILVVVKFSSLSPQIAPTVETSNIVCNVSIWHITVNRRPIITHALNEKLFSGQLLVCPRQNHFDRTCQLCLDVPNTSCSIRKQMTPTYTDFDLPTYSSPGEGNHVSGVWTSLRG